MGKISDFIGRIKKVRHIEIIIGSALIIAVLAVYFSCVSCSKPETNDKNADVSGDYCTVMQARLERVVSEISGVGDASIIINWDKSAAVSYTQAATENPKATGAIVVCDGGGSTKVKLDVTYAVSTLLGLSIDKIIVYPKS